LQDNGDPFESLAVDEPVNLYVAVAFWSGDSARSTRLKLYGNTYGVGASAGQGVVFDAATISPHTNS
jgi:hypothetical protein